jgi:hypothetical protein
MEMMYGRFYLTTLKIEVEAFVWLGNAELICELTFLEESKARSCRRSQTSAFGEYEEKMKVEVEESRRSWSP